MSTGRPDRLRALCDKWVARASSARTVTFLDWGSKYNNERGDHFTYFVATFHANGAQVGLVRIVRRVVSGEIEWLEGANGVGQDILLSWQSESP